MCEIFLNGGLVTVTSHPTLPPSQDIPDDIGKISTSAELGYGGEAYFNYDKDDLQYGPSSGGWSNVKGNAEFQRYEEMNGTLRRDLHNKCTRNMKQSPIDLCGDLINADCSE